MLTNLICQLYHKMLRFVAFFSRKEETHGMAPKPKANLELLEKSFQIARLPEIRLLRMVVFQGFTLKQK